jgi:hypothetical protein
VPGFIKLPVYFRTLLLAKGNDERRRRGLKVWHAQDLVRMATARAMVHRVNGILVARQTLVVQPF